MEQQYLYGLISFGVGSAAGFQGVSNRYKNDSFQAIKTPPGAFYLLSRGLVPALVFLAGFQFQIITDNFLMYAFITGTGVEVILRIKFYIKAVEKDGITEEILRGPFDLVQWYQQLLLELTAEYIANGRKQFLERYLPKTKQFLTLVQQAMTNILAWTPSPQIDTLVSNIQRMETEYRQEISAGNDPLKTDDIYKYKLGYLVLYSKGRNGFKTLLTP